MLAAENLFWLARYAERAEDMIRLIRNIHTRRNETLQLADPVYQTTLDDAAAGSDPHEHDLPRLHGGRRRATPGRATGGDLST